MQRLRTHARSRPARGFSLIEALISLMLLVTVVALISSSLTAAYAARTVASARSQMSAALTANLDIVTQTPMGDLLDGTFTVPAPCTDTGPGITGRSCVTLGATQVTFAYRFVNDEAGASCPGRSADPREVVQTTGLLQVQACVVSVTSRAFADGTTGASAGLAAQNRTLSPDPGFVVDGRTVSVHLTGALAALDSRPLYLVLAADPTQQVTTATVDADGWAHLQLAAVTDRNVCTPAVPCMLALAAAPDPTMTPTSPEGPWVRVTDVAGSGALVTVADHATTRVDATVQEQP